jgi:hypothetical protein
MEIIKMGYDFTPKNTDAGSFRMGAFLFPHFLEQCGAYFLCIQQPYGAKYFFVSGIDERMPEGDNYPRLISNDGFPVTEEEAKVLARIARNYVTIQRSLEDQPEDDYFLKPVAMQPWPRKIREDLVDHLEKFADWAEQSGGFEIW